MNIESAKKTLISQNKTHRNRAGRRGGGRALLGKWSPSSKEADRKKFPGNKEQTSHKDGVIPTKKRNKLSRCGLLAGFS
jgi:hypothetical protein